MEIDSDIVLSNTNKIVTSQIAADDFGTLELKASHIHFIANDISFDLTQQKSLQATSHK